MVSVAASDRATWHTLSFVRAAAPHQLRVYMQRLNMRGREQAIARHALSLLRERSDAFARRRYEMVQDMLRMCLEDFRSGEDQILACLAETRSVQGERSATLENLQEELEQEIMRQHRAFGHVLICKADRKVRMATA
jgi:hypothetical protein